jgi:hypothetical protein
MTSDLTRDDWGPEACNEPQPYNWKHACSRKKGHKGEHRVRLGHDDLAWIEDESVEVAEPLAAAAYVTGV